MGKKNKIKYFSTWKKPKNISKAQHERIIYFAQKQKRKILD